MPHEIADIRLECSHCGSTEFQMRRTSINTLTMTLISNLDWSQKSARIYICRNCGRMEWFIDSVSEGGPDYAEISDTDCPSCGRVIPAGESTCLECGWPCNDQAQDEEPAPPSTFTPVSPDSSQTDCLACGEVIPGGESKCPSCGWSYKQ